MWLAIGKDYLDKLHFATFTVRPYYGMAAVSYRFTDDGDRLLAQWKRCSQEEDPLLSGIFADWLEDHREMLLDGAVGPTSPSVRLDELISYLRSRFNSQNP